MTVKYGAVQKGGAVVECVVLAIVMVPLFLMIPTLGNLIDLKQSVVQASRYSAWEQTANTGMTPPSDVRARFFEDPEVLLTSGQIGTGGANTLWNTNPQAMTAQNDSGIVEAGIDDTVIGISFEDGAGVSFTPDVNSGPLSGTIGHATHAAATALGHLSGTEWEFEKNGLLDAGVQISVKRNWLLSDGIGACDGQQGNTHFGCISAHTALVADGWDSAFVDQAADRSRSFVPGTLLSGVGRVVSNLGYLPVTRELKGLKHAFGYVDPTVLPLDRYAEQRP